MEFSLGLVEISSSAMPPLRLKFDGPLGVCAMLGKVGLCGGAAEAAEDGLEFVLRGERN